MKRLRLISAVCLIMIGIAVVIATYNLASLYNHEKEMMMQTVEECVENAVILEIISRMKSSDKATQSFIRLNSYIENSQHTDGRNAQTDSLRTSLASVLRVGLDFTDINTRVNLPVLNRMFRNELTRHDLHPSMAIIEHAESIKFKKAGHWKIDYKSNSSSKPEYTVYVSPMPGRVLSRMWGIIIPFTAVIIIMAFLSCYLLRRIREMRTIEEMKDDFAHNMTHELKTPVAVAYSAADSMLRYYDQSDEARNRHFLRIIMQRLSFLSGMIENILSMSMERFKAMELNIENVRLKQMVEDVANMMELKADKPMEIEIDVPENLSVEADSLHLGNVLSNLIDNALKYSGDSVRIMIKADAHSIAITDNGIGIDRDNLPFIFDKFYRVASGDRYEVGGYGLGLFYVRQVAELFGWSIEVTSKPGEGSKFTFRFDGNEKR